MESRRKGTRLQPRKDLPEDAQAPDAELPDPNHVVVEPVEGAAQAFGAAIAGGASAILPVIGNLFEKDGSLSLPAVFGILVFTLLIGWGVLQALGRARQREVFWEATRNGLIVHMDNIGTLDWDQIRLIEPVKAGPGWLTGDPVVALKVYPWMPRDVRRRLKPDPDVKYFVRRPVMTGEDRYLRLPIWQTKMREHGKEIEARLQGWHASSAAR